MSANAEAEAAAARFSLPLRKEKQSGLAGNWTGTGIGSSVDFQDHRPYHPGDDPRYINWQAYARTGEYTMKLYREEVSPRVDILVDASASMFLEPDKKARTVELLCFCIASSLRAGTQPKAYTTKNKRIQLMDPKALTAGHVDALNTDDLAQLLPVEQVPWRNNSMRIIISDLLFIESPNRLIKHCITERSQTVFFVPWTQQEAQPSWIGDLELIDCETRSKRMQHVSDDLRKSYQDNYRKHFAAWHAAVKSRGAVLARIPSMGTLTEALLAHALPAGAVELWS